jgi:hypothetical protein
MTTAKPLPPGVEVSFHPSHPKGGIRLEVIVRTEEKESPEEPEIGTWEELLKFEPGELTYEEVIHALNVIGEADPWVPEDEDGWRNARHHHVRWRIRNEKLETKLMVTRAHRMFFPGGPKEEAEEKRLEVVRILRLAGFRTTVPFWDNKPKDIEGIANWAKGLVRGENPGIHIASRPTGLVRTTEEVEEVPAPYEVTWLRRLGFEAGATAERPLTTITIRVNVDRACLELQRLMDVIRERGWQNRAEVRAVIPVVANRPAILTWVMGGNP